MAGPKRQYRESPQFVGSSMQTEEREPLYGAKLHAPGRDCVGVRV
jgi:hypothetical protein